MGSIWSQTFPPAPALTERNLPSQAGKVFIVTGGASGIGFELSRILFKAGARVYIAGRSESKARAAIQCITESAGAGAGKGELFFLALQLDDLSTIAASVKTFTSQECKLDVLWNNAGTGPVFSCPPTAQGLDFHIATNCLGPFLFTQLLLPSLHAAGSGRVVWTSSMLVDAAAPPGGIDLASLEKPPKNDPNSLYTLTKVGNWFLASELAKRTKGSGTISIAQNPGNLKTGVWRHQHWLMPFLLSPILYKPIFGAYTELWAGLSDEVNEAHNGDMILPWGRWHDRPREDILDALKSQDEGGKGTAKKFWEWCEQKTAPFI